MKCTVIRKNEQCIASVSKLEKTLSSFEQEQTRLYHYRHRHHYHRRYYSYYDSIIVTIYIISISKIWTGMSEKKVIPEKDNSDFLDQFLDTSLAHAHPIHHLAILLDLFLLPIFGLIHFYLNFFS